MKTIRVRIAVAVDKDGSWNSSGWQNASGPPRRDEYHADVAMETVSTSAVLRFVEADIPLPQMDTIEGEVTT